MEEERVNIRKRIKGPATNIQTQIVNICSEYRDELTQLEKDNKKLKADNDNLTELYKRSQKSSELLRKEYRKRLRLKKNQYRQAREAYRQSRKRYQRKIAFTGEICYRCSHGLDCYSSLCIYCQKYVCRCCNDWCSGNGCYKHMCKTCFEDNGTHCPEHNPNISEEEKKTLLEYYTNN